LKQATKEEEASKTIEKQTIPPDTKGESDIDKGREIETETETESNSDQDDFG
jgi:hypothetical protein